MIIQRLVHFLFPFPYFFLFLFLIHLHLSESICLQIIFEIPKSAVWNAWLGLIQSTASHVLLLYTDRTFRSRESSIIIHRRIRPDPLLSLNYAVLS
jgi:hypothetical protein